MRHLSRLTSDFENKKNTVKKYLKIKKRFGIFFILNVTVPFEPSIFLVTRYLNLIVKWHFRIGPCSI